MDDKEIKIPTEKEIDDMIEACRPKEPIILPIISKKQFDFLKKHFPEHIVMFTEDKFTPMSIKTE